MDYILEWCEQWMDNNGNIIGSINKNSHNFKDKRNIAESMAKLLCKRRESIAIESENHGISHSIVGKISLIEKADVHKRVIKEYDPETP